VYFFLVATVTACIYFFFVINRTNLANYLTFYRGNPNAIPPVPDVPEMLIGDKGFAGCSTFIICAPYGNIADPNRRAFYREMNSIRVRCEQVKNVILNELKQ
jgi:hypothetical protein